MKEKFTFTSQEKITRRKSCSKENETKKDDYKRVMVNIVSCISCMTIDKDNACLKSLAIYVNKREYRRVYV